MSTWENRCLDEKKNKIKKKQNEEHIQVPLAFVQVFHGLS